MKDVFLAGTQDMRKFSKLNKLFVLCLLHYSYYTHKFGIAFSLVKTIIFAPPLPLLDTPIDNYLLHSPSLHKDS